ncbi:MAG: hypothetical protein WBA28_07675 [Microbacteriaceae bacterium]
MKLADDSGYFTLINTGYDEEGYRMDYFLSSPEEVVSGNFTSIYPELITQCGDVIYGAHNKTQIVPSAAPPEEFQLMQLYPLTENPKLAVFSQQLPDGWHLSYTSDSAPCIDGVVYAIGAVSNTGYGAPEIETELIGQSGTFFAQVPTLLKWDTKSGVLSIINLVDDQGETFPPESHMPFSTNRNGLEVWGDSIYWLNGVNHAVMKTSLETGISEALWVVEEVRDAGASQNTQYQLIDHQLHLVNLDKDSFKSRYRVYNLGNGRVLEQISLEALSLSTSNFGLSGFAVRAEDFPN